MNHEQITSNFSCKYHRAANVKIVEHWSNLGQYFPKKERKSRYKSNFQCVSLRRQIVCLWICHVTFLECALRFGFLITLETLSFFSLKSSLEFIIITPHNMQKTRRSKERTNMDLHDNICRGSPIQFLTPPDRVFECHLIEFPKGYCKIHISSIWNKCQNLRIIGKFNEIKSVKSS